MARTADEVREILNRLRNELENPVCELNYKTPFELLVAVVLSAQCTDKRVNQVTPRLFALADTPEAMAALDEEVIREIIRPVGCFNRKAQAIKRLSQALAERHNSIVPSDIDTLMTLDGVGRKTANVVHAVAFGGDAIAVDTHVRRVSNRLGLADSDDVRKVEDALMSAIEKSEWSEAHHLLLHHGRYICTARSPKCDMCMLSDMCGHYGEVIGRAAPLKTGNKV